MYKNFILPDSNNDFGVSKVNKIIKIPLRRLSDNQLTQFPLQCGTRPAG
jgi:hypothetical protein